MRFSASTNDRLKSVVPPGLLRLIRSEQLRAAQAMDRRRYLRYSSSVSPQSSRTNLAAWITMLYHNIEKGLALPCPRPCFGAERITRLLDFVYVYRTQYGDDDVIRAAIAALEAYRQFNLGEGVCADEIPETVRIEELLPVLSGTESSGGVMEVKRSTIDHLRSGVALEFFTSRSSVRQFSDKPVSRDDIDFAVAAALKSPAVCNRQFGRVYVTSDREVIARALAIQGGARGFADDVPAIAVVTTSVRSYWNAGERMQPWTDGGMFAMSFILGLHAVGLGSVCLNWSKTAEVDREFRRVFDIEDDRVIVMMIAFGNLRDQYRVAVSPRISRDEALQPLNLARN